MALRRVCKLGPGQVLSNSFDRYRNFVSFSTWPEWLSPDLGGRQRTMVPLNQSLSDGTSSPSGYKAPAKQPPTELTTLANGVRIISEATPGPTASMGIYVDSGSMHEKSLHAGSSALLECLSFKSTLHRSASRLNFEVDKIGSHVMANASREQMSYTIDCLKTNMPAALELLCDAVLNPLLDPLEVEEQKMRLLMLLESKDVQLTLLNEMLVQKAYTGALGKPLIPNMEQLSRLSSDSLRRFLADHYTGSRMILAASGVEHSKLVDLVKPMLEKVPNSPTIIAEEPSSQYVGAYVHLPGPHPQPNILLAFEYAGGWRDVQGAVNMTVLTYLLGGGSSFSSGGPGKGMHSRLYTRVLSQYHWAHSCTAFNSTFNQSGLVGIQASCEPAYVPNLLNVMCNEIEAVSRSIGHVELERAKKAAISIISNALESKATSSEDIGRQFLTYGHRISGREYVDMISAVTPSDLSSFVSRLLSSKPSLAVYGDGVESANYDVLLTRYGSASGIPYNTSSKGQSSSSTSDRLRKALGF